MKEFDRRMACHAHGMQLTLEKPSCLTWSPRFSSASAKMILSWPGTTRSSLFLDALNIGTKLTLLEPQINSIYRSDNRDRPAPFQNDGECAYFSRAVIFMYNLFTFQCIQVELMTSHWQIKDRFVQRGGMATSMVCQQTPLFPPSSHSAIFPAFCFTQPRSLFTGYDRAVTKPKVSNLVPKITWNGYKP